MDAVLTPGEWEALLFQVPTQVKHLVFKLAVNHGHCKPTPAECPICSKRIEPKQLELG